jgi:CBS domain-containing protein
MSTVSDILWSKGTAIFTVGAHDTVYEAIARMDRRGVGALVVLEDERLVGLITERDYLRKVALLGRSSRHTRVDAIMSAPEPTVTSWHPCHECLELMSSRRVRHLPVLEQGRLVGLVSMGDIVKQLLGDQRYEIDHLVSYIQTGSAPPPEGPQSDKPRH